MLAAAPAVALSMPSEALIGSNFLRQYQVTVSIADGQVITDLDITDTLLDNIVVTAITTSAGTANPDSLTLPLGPLDGSTTPTNVIRLANVPSVTGTGGSDVTVTVEFYVPRMDAGGDEIIPPNLGTPAQATNQADAEFFWASIPLGDGPYQFRFGVTVDAAIEAGDTPWTLEANLVGASNSAVPPTFVLPAGRISVAGQTVTFNLGTVTNNDGDANIEFVTIKFNARIDNVGGNVDSVSLSNAFDLFVDGGQVGTTQSTTIVPNFGWHSKCLGALCG